MALDRGATEASISIRGAGSRQHFERELEELERRTLGGLDLVVAQLERTLRSLRGHDVALAEAVIAADDEVDRRYMQLHQAIVTLLALQAPVAGDLRLVAALLHLLRAFERMGDQCVNIAKLTALSGREPPVSADILEHLLAMGACAREEVLQCKEAFAKRDLALAEDLVRQDREINGFTARCSAWRWRPTATSTGASGSCT